MSGMGPDHIQLDKPLTYDSLTIDEGAHRDHLGTTPRPNCV